MKFTHYQGEAHPDTRKVVLTFHIKDLFNGEVLSTPLSKHKFLLLAGPRWQPPNASFVERWNTALSKGENFLSDICQKEDDLGSVKIASNSMPHESQNMKWCSDVLDRMVSEANVRVKSLVYAYSYNYRLNLPFQTCHLMSVLTSLPMLGAAAHLDHPRAIFLKSGFRSLATPC